MKTEKAFMKSTLKKFSRKLDRVVAGYSNIIRYKIFAKARECPMKNAYMTRVYETVCKRNPDEPEFKQAVHRAGMLMMQDRCLRGWLSRTGEYIFDIGQMRQMLEA